MHTVFILFTYFSFFFLSVSTIAFDVRDCWVENFSFIFIKFRWPLFAFHLNATAFLVRPTIEWMTIAIFFYFYFSFVFISNILSISYFHLHERFVACLMQTMTAYIMQYWIYVFFFLLSSAARRFVYTLTNIVRTHALSSISLNIILLLCARPVLTLKSYFIPTKWSMCPIFLCISFHIIYRLRQSDIFHMFSNLMSIEKYMVARARLRTNFKCLSLLVATCRTTDRPIEWDA